MKSLFLPLGFFFFVNEFTPVVAMKSKKAPYKQRKEVSDEEVLQWWALNGNTWAEFLTKPDKTPWCPYIPTGFTSKIYDNKTSHFYDGEGWGKTTVTKELVFICTACQHEVKSYNMFDILRRRQNKNVKADSCCSTCCHQKLTKIAQTKLQYPEEAQEKIFSSEIIETEEAQETISSFEVTKTEEVCEGLSLENLLAWRSLTEELMNQEFQEEQRECPNRIQERNNGNTNKNNINENQIRKEKWHVVKKK